MRSIGGIVVVVVFALTAGCADDGGDASRADSDGTSGSDAPASGADTGPIVSLGAGPTTTLPSCPVPDPATVPAWPFALPGAIVAASTSSSQLTYSVSGITNNPEAVLVAALEESFPDYEPTEPTGGSSDISIEFSSDAGVASLAMDDADGDGCWNVDIVAEYVAEPELLPVETPGDDSAASPDRTDSGDDLDDVAAVGTGQIITGRGTFALTITRCELEPVAIDAVAPEGTLEIRPEGDHVGVTWRYTDEDDEITDADPNVTQLVPTGGAMFAEGEGPDGLESLVIEWVCG